MNSNLLLLFGDRQQNAANFCEKLFVVFWLVNIRQTTICEVNSYIYRKEYLQERETVSNKNIGLVIE